MKDGVTDSTEFTQTIQNLDQTEGQGMGLFLSVGNGSTDKLLQCQTRGGTFVLDLNGR